MIGMPRKRALHSMESCIACWSGILHTAKSLSVATRRLLRVDTNSSGLVAM